MNKELTPLEALYKHESLLVPRYEGGFDTPFDLTKEFKIIEAALKDYEETDNQLYDLFEKFGINNRKDLLKKLKALEIIKDYFIFSDDPYDKVLTPKKPMEKEKIDLLKEVSL